MEDANQMLARLAVRAVLERYFSCVDRQDWEGLGACFAADATAVYNSAGPQHLTGRDAIVAKVQVVKRFNSTHHVFANTDIVLARDDAKAQTQAIAYLLIGPAESGRVLVRGLRYDDELSRTDGLWRIRRRTHMPLWQYEAKALPPGY